MLLFPSLAPPLATLQTGAGIYFTRGKKTQTLSDHSCMPKASPEPYRKGSSAPAIITNTKAIRPPCSSSDRLRCNKQHTDVGSFQQSLKETQDPRQKHAQLPAGPEGKAQLPGEIPVLTGGLRTGSTAAAGARHPGTVPICSSGGTRASAARFGKPPAFLPLLYATNTRFK